MHIVPGADNGTLYARAMNIGEAILKVSGLVLPRVKLHPIYPHMYARMHIDTHTHKQTNKQTETHALTHKVKPNNHLVILPRKVKPNNHVVILSQKVMCCFIIKCYR